MQTPTLEQRKAEQQPPNQSVVMKQTWSQLLFLHWEYEASLIQKTLPKGLYVDEFEGKAYLGIVPFRMEKIRPRFLPPVPWLSWFNEINLRTYVHDENGRPGVWFYSLDCDQPLAVQFARSFFHLPYQHAKMGCKLENEQRHYSSHRRGAEKGDTYSYQSTSKNYNQATEGTLDFFLAERYLLYSTNRKGELFSGRVHHSPYEIQPAKVTTHSAELINLEGFPPPESPVCSQLIAKAVNVNVYPLQQHTP